jgi:hypothetical protein
MITNTTPWSLGPIPNKSPETRAFYSDSTAGVTSLRFTAPQSRRLFRTLNELLPCSSFVPPKRIEFPLYSSKFLQRKKNFSVNHQTLARRERISRSTQGKMPALPTRLTRQPSQPVDLTNFNTASYFAGSAWWCEAAAEIPTPQLI